MVLQQLAPALGEFGNVGIDRDELADVEFFRSEDEVAVKLR